MTQEEHNRIFQAGYAAGYEAAANNARSEAVMKITEEVLGSTDGIVTDFCGCRYNWNDHFYESRCADCAATDDEANEEYHYSIAMQAA